jgi:hypothetical protein
MMEIRSYSSQLLVLHCSSTCSRLHKIGDKGIPSVVQCIKAVLFFTERRSVMVTQRRFYAHCQTWWAPSFKTVYKLCNQFNNNDSVCILWRTLTLSQWSYKEAPVKQQGRLQHNWGYPEDLCNEYSKVIWIFIHIKWKCCLNLQFKTNIK